jgi:hypothetical protein
MSACISRQVATAYYQRTGERVQDAARRMSERHPDEIARELGFRTTAMLRRYLQARGIAYPWRQRRGCVARRYQEAMGESVADAARRLAAEGMSRTRAAMLIGYATPAKLRAYLERIGEPWPWLPDHQSGHQHR